MMMTENPARSTSKVKHINNNLVATVLSVTVKTQKQSLNKGRVPLTYEGYPWAPPVHRHLYPDQIDGILALP
jgi:hypothetical protein